MVSSLGTMLLLYCTISISRHHTLSALYLATCLLTYLLTYLALLSLLTTCPHLVYLLTSFLRHHTLIDLRTYQLTNLLAC